MRRSGWVSRTSARQAARTSSRGALVGDAQHVVGVALGVGDELGADAQELAVGELEDGGDAGEELVLLGVVVAVGHGDVEQPLEEVAELRRAVAEHPADPAGVVLEARDVLAGEVVDAGDVGLLLVGDDEDLAEGRDLVAGDEAVGLGDLGAERDGGDGEAHGLLGRGPQALEEAGQGLAALEAGQGLGDARPDGHEGLRDDEVHRRRPISTRSSQRPNL